MIKRRKSGKGDEFLMGKKREQRMRKTLALTVALAMAVLLSACTLTSGKGGQQVGNLDRETEGTLKVAYFDEQAFHLQYGNAFTAMFPNVTIEVVPLRSVMNASDPLAELEALVNEQQPDVLFLTEDEYAYLASKGQLYDLEPIVKQDDYELDDFHPAVVELLKAHGGGKLLGLSPSFSSQVLYYNKSLFEAHGVPYPTDRMSWEEALQLAARFPVKKDGSDALYGLAASAESGDLFGLVRKIGAAKGLSYVDADGTALVIDTPEWKEVFQAVVDGYKSGAVAIPEDNGRGGPGIAVRLVGGRNAFQTTQDAMKFLQGKAAMAVGGPFVMNMLGLSSGGAAAARSVSGSGGEEAPPLSGGFEWDVVTLPVDPMYPDVTDGIGLDSIFSIHAASGNVPLAWEFLKYANGEQLAKTSGRTGPELSSRVAYKKEIEGKNMEAFYALGVNEQLLLERLPDGFTASFSKLASEQLMQVVNGAVSLDDALRTLQSQGQDLLTQAGLNE